jgi:secreted trypsin-like serine protease
MIKKLTLLGALVVALVLGAVPAAAITDGDLDLEGHPYVGLMVAQDAAGNPLWRCSGTLMSATVFLTAGHCTEAPAAHAEIWFQSDVEHGRPGNGYPFLGQTGGVTKTHPSYDPNRFFVRDLGVVILTRPAPASITTYGRLPANDQLESLNSKRGQQDTTFTAVGYGLQASFPDAASWQDVALRIRMVAHPKLNQIDTGFVGDFSILLSNNANTGGTCFGDSGGPNFVGTSRTLAGVTSFGINGNCAGTGGVYRLDRSWNLDWLHSSAVGL